MRKGGVASVVLIVAGALLVADDGRAANAIRGGLLWDRWWAVNGAPAPAGTHPL